MANNTLIRSIELFEKSFLFLCENETRYLSQFSNSKRRNYFTNKPIISFSLVIIVI